MNHRLANEFATGLLLDNIAEHKAGLPVGALLALFGIPADDAVAHDKVMRYWQGNLSKRALRRWLHAYRVKHTGEMW
jgi:hypothetical protein